MPSRPLTAQEQQDLHVQLAYFWNGRTPEERNEYANVLMFLMLEDDDPVAPAAFEIIVHEIIKSPTTPMPFAGECDEELRAAVAVAVMEKLRTSEADPWRRLMDYQREHPGIGGNFRAWLRLIAFRTAVDVMRRHPLHANANTDPHWRETVPVDEWDDASESMEQWYRETPLDVRLDVLRTLAVTGQWLEQQDPVDARMLCLRVDQGLGYGEIAEQVGLTPDAVRKRVTRLRSRLRQHLDDPELLGLSSGQPSESDQP